MCLNEYQLAVMEAVHLTPSSTVHLSVAVWTADGMTPPLQPTRNLCASSAVACCVALALPPKEPAQTGMSVAPDTVRSGLRNLCMAHAFCSGLQVVQFWPVGSFNCCERMRHQQTDAMGATCLKLKGGLWLRNVLPSHQQRSAVSSVQPWWRDSKPHLDM
jgi:hypothetical protein